jgi:RHS repeat-associated protein
VSSSGSLGSGTYSYGAFGIRAVKVTSGNTTVSIYDGNHAIADYTNGALANEYMYLGGQLIASRLSGTLYYHAFDHQSIRVHLDASGNIVGQKGQYPNGEDWYTSTLTNRHYTTYARDVESANDNALHRFYVNRLARFSSTDPVPGGGANPQGFNLYSYVHNDPVNRLDLDGRHLIDCDAWTGEGCGNGNGGEMGGLGSLPSGCVGFLDPTICGDCNTSSILEGNSCPAPEPVPEPPPPTPANANAVCNCRRTEVAPTKAGTCEYDCNCSPVPSECKSSGVPFSIYWELVKAEYQKEYGSTPSNCPSQVRFEAMWTVIPLPPNLNICTSVFDHFLWVASTN